MKVGRSLLWLVPVILAVAVIDGAVPKKGRKSMSEDEKALYKKHRDRIIGESERNEREFKAMVLDEIWRTAQRKYSGDLSKLETVKTELKDLSELEKLVMKAMKEKSDPDGELSQAFRVALQEFTKKYKLEPDQKSMEQMKKAGLKLNKQLEKDKSMKKALKDPKLVKFWNTISNMEYLRDDLDLLREELMHYQSKLDEFNYATQSGVMEFFKSVDRLKLMTSSNLLEDFPELSNFDKDETSLERERVRFIALSNILATGFDRLNLVTNASAEFKQPVVDKLWGEVQNGNFSFEEMEGLKLELSHLDEKLTSKQTIERQMDRIGKVMSTNNENSEKQPPAEIKEKAMERAKSNMETHKSLSAEILDKMKSLKEKISGQRSLSEL